MLTKTFVKSRKIWRVTFELPQKEWPEDTDVDSVHLAGDFNGWDASSTPLKRRGDTFRVTVELQGGSDYQFRYLINKTLWYNEWHADGYVPTPASVDNCLLRLPEQ
jgi:hypothetical protein